MSGGGGLSIQLAPQDGPPGTTKDNTSLPSARGTLHKDLFISQVWAIIYDMHGNSDLSKFSMRANMHAQ